MPEARLQLGGRDRDFTRRPREPTLRAPGAHWYDGQPHPTLTLTRTRTRTPTLTLTRTRSLTQVEGNYRDDITAMVVYLPETIATLRERKSSQERSASPAATPQDQQTGACAGGDK